MKDGRITIEFLFFRNSLFNDFYFLSEFHIRDEISSKEHFSMAMNFAKDLKFVLFSNSYRFCHYLFIRLLVNVAQLRFCLNINIEH